MEHLQDKSSGILRSIGRIFKFDAVYLARGGSWMTLSFVVGTLGSIVTMIAFGNLLPKETYGTYSYLLSLGASLSFLTLTGVGPAVIRSVARGYENLVPYALRLAFKYNLLSVVIILSVAGYYGYRGNILFASSLALLALAYPIAESFHIYKAVLTGKKRFDILTHTTNIVTVVGAAATVTTLVLTDNIFYLIALYTIMVLVPNVIIYRKTAKSLNTSGPVDREQLEEMRRTSFHFTGAGVIGIIASYIDKIILFQAAGPAPLAIYTFATAGPERLKSLAKNWISVAVPSLAQRSLSQIRIAFYRRMGLSFIVGIILALAYTLIAPILFKLFLPNYLEAILYSQILSLSLIAIPATVYIGSIFSSQNMIKATYQLNFGSQIVRIALFIILGWLWQIWGLVAAALLSSFINALYSVIVWEIEVRRLIKLQENSSIISP